MITPFALRGLRYNTALYLRCNRFRSCDLCSMCREYNPHHVACVVCEANKSGGEKCRCTHEQLLSYRMISDRLGYEPWEAAAGQLQPSPVDVTAYEDWDELVSGLSRDNKLTIEI